MSAQEQIAKLESLLDRVRRNAAKLRTAVAPRVEAAPAPAPVAELISMAALAEPPPPIEASPSPSAPAVEVAAVEAEPSIEDLDMMDVEIVEIAVESVAVAPEGTVEESDEPPDTIDEPIPESAPRPAAAAIAAKPEPEAPIHTPPPESGRQAVATTAHESATEADLTGSGDVDSLLEADLSGGPISRAPADNGPTMEQLGNTVELEGATAPAAHLELDAAPSTKSVEEAPDELELQLPQKQFSGGYDAGLAPPSSASKDLEEIPSIESFAPPPAEAPQAVVAAPAEPTVVTRPHVEGPAAEVIVAARPRTPDTFLEVLDASLSLRA